MPPAPKPANQRQRRNLRSTAATVTAAPAERTDLPKAYDKRTKAWWSTIWSSPISGEWVDADVAGLEIVASVLDRYWQTGDPKAVAEFRMQAREYGLSPFSRRQLQWEIRKVEGVKPAAPKERRSDRAPLRVLSA